MAPGILCYLSGFYTRKELSLRFVYSISLAYFCRQSFKNRFILFNRLGGWRANCIKKSYPCLPQLSGAFSGLLAAAIQKMDGVGGKPGWAWIFILVRRFGRRHRSTTFY